MMTRKEMFEARLKEAGVKYTITNFDKDMVKTEVVFNDKDSEEQWNRDTLAVQGLIYHFSNRKWIINDSYLYIRQNVHTFEFNEEDGDE